MNAIREHSEPMGGDLELSMLNVETYLYTTNPTKCRHSALDAQWNWWCSIVVINKFNSEHYI